MTIYLTGNPYWHDMEVEILEIDKVCPALTVAKVKVLNEKDLVHPSDAVQVVNITDLVEVPDNSTVHKEPTTEAKA